jgi:Right handed beta helix region
MCLAALLVSSSVQATTYYVATNGDDTWDGSSPTYVSGTTGPFADFGPINWSSANQLAPGDVLYVLGGIYYHTNDSTATALRIYGVNATQSNPIIVSNYPGQYPVIYGSGPNNNNIDIRSSSWIKIIGLNETNAYRGVSLQSVTNCEVAYCDFGGGNTNYGYMAPFTMYISSQLNWIHNCTIHDALAAPVGDSTHGFEVGNFYGTNDVSAYNIIESNVLFHAGHDVLGVCGPFNLIRGNFIHNEAWYYRQDFQTNGGHRCMEVGGYLAFGNVVDGNRCQDAGLNNNGGSHGLELDGTDNNIVRNNVFTGNTYSGFTIYGGKFGSSMFWGSNYVYGNTIALNGFGPAFVTTYDSNGNPVGTNQNTIWKCAITVANSTNNFFVNNLLSGNYQDGLLCIGVPGAIDTRGNQTNAMSGVLFVNPSDGGPWSQTQPDFHLTRISAAFSTGTWLAAITSSSGSGTSFKVDNAGWFFAGLTAAGHVVPGDSIQLQGQTRTATILSISGNTIIFTPALTWTTGQGVALSYPGIAPNVGALSSLVDNTIGPPSGLITSPPH